MTGCEYHQCAFLVQFHPHAAAEGRFEGRVEHIASGRALRFQALEEFLAFVRQRQREGDPSQAEELAEPKVGTEMPQVAEKQAFGEAFGRN